jgi:hypothetical protein
MLHEKVPRASTATAIATDHRTFFMEAVEVLEIAMGVVMVMTLATREIMA